jgi:glycine/D-amino acid oxidase-like deaminating enzyme
VRSVFIRKVKRAGATGLWGAYPVGRDGHGVWLYTPGRSLYRGTSSSGEAATCYAGWPDPPGAPLIHLIPMAGWWFARWQDVPTGAHVAIDLCTPCLYHDGVWSYDDLELDLLKFRHGVWRLDDQDEFEHEVSLGRISAREREVSLQTVSELQARLDQHDEVFDVLGWDRLEHYESQHFAPLTEFL